MELRASKRWTQMLASGFLLTALFLGGCSSEVHFVSIPPVDENGELNSQDATRQEEPKNPNSGTKAESSDPGTVAPEAKKLEQTFAASETYEGNVTLTAGVQEVTRTIDLRSVHHSKSKEFNQINRSKVTKFYRQGHPGMAKTEEFNQLNIGVLDLLIVIDNSASMLEEQKNLAARLDPLMQFVNESDWRINVVTTDPKDGCSRAVIRRGDPNVQTVFQQAVMAGTTGSSNEQGIRMAVQGLSCAQTPWLRPNSAIAILFVSDEDNCSDRGISCPEPYKSPSYLLNHLSQNLGRTLGKDARVYGLIFEPGSTCRDAANEGTQYAELITATQGKSGSICDRDYSTTLRSISADVGSILNGDFNLANIPEPGSVTVKINGVAQVSGFTLKSQSIHFDPKPPYGAKIEVSYITNAVPVVSRFRLEQIPAPETLEVLLNGQRVNQSEYSIDSSSMELVFANPPPADADIKVEFRTNTPLNSSFPLEDGVITGSVQVKVNGTDEKDFTLNSGNTLRLSSPPQDGALIRVTYETRGEAILNYPLGVKDDMIKDLKIVDSDTGVEVDAVLRQGALIFDRQDHRDGRRLTVTYEDSESGHIWTKLPEFLVKDSIKINPVQGTCAHAVQGQELELHCDTPNGTAIHIGWKFRSPVRQTFTLSGAPDPENGLWTVLIDGVATAAFERQGSDITIKQPLAPEAIVTIAFQPRF